MSDETKQPEPSPPANGERLHIYFLPNLMTAGNLLCGFLALTFIVQVVPDSTGSEGPVFSEADIDKIKNALWLILGAFVFDGLDGRIARLVGKESPFGLQFDSLADIISFGAAPAFLMQRVILHDFNVEIERLGEIFESFAVASAHRRIERILSRQHDYRHVGSHSSDRVDRRQTVAIGKHDVGQHHIENAIAEKSVSPRYRVAGNDFEPFFAQRLGDDRRDAPVVFDQ